MSYQHFSEMTYETSKRWYFYSDHKWYYYDTKNRISIGQLRPSDQVLLKQTGKLYIFNPKTWTNLHKKGFMPYLKVYDRVKYDIGFHYDFYHLICVNRFKIDIDGNEYIESLFDFTVPNPDDKNIVFGDTGIFEDVYVYEEASFEPIIDDGCSESTYPNVKIIN